MSVCLACNKEVQHVNEVTDLCAMCHAQVLDRARLHQISQNDAATLWEAWNNLAEGMTAKRALLISDAYAKACQKGWHTAAAGALLALRGV